MFVRIEIRKQREEEDEMNQTTIFDMLYSKKKITKPIRLIELFSGYGSQALALKYLGVPFEHWKICEWAIKSIQAYKDIHFTNEYHFYGFMEETKDDLANYLYKLGISSNYNEPMTLEQIKRLKHKDLCTICENIYITNNLVNIQLVKGKDLEITDTNKYEYIMTYSFPCQDLSLAGKGKGMSDKSTRSGMLWEVERILTECYELGEMPQILLMENVPQVHSEDNVEDFNKWKDRLEELGYKNYFQDLIASDYGIPQTRNRCFMISLLGDYSYTFPKPMPLKLKLKDMLEDNVDEKYYLSDVQIENIKKSNYAQNQRRIQKDEICDTLCARDWKDPKCIQVNNKSLQETLEQNQIDETCYIDTYNRRIDKEKSGTITTGVSFRNNTFLAIKNNNSKGYLEATDGDGIDISSRMEHHRGTVQKDKIQTLTTSGGNDRGVVINPLKGISGRSWQFEQQVYDDNGSARTLKASEGSGNIPKVISDLKIRKLTPRECFRLMGVKDEDFDKVKVNQSDSSLYHLAGDSIVVNVLMAIFKELL